MEKKVPMRTCIACRTCKPKKELIRIVKAEDGVFLDRTGKKNGRGAYICPSKACLKKARKRLEANLGCNIPEEIFIKLEEEIDNING